MVSESWEKTRPLKRVGMAAATATASVVGKENGDWALTSKSSSVRKPRMENPSTMSSSMESLELLLLFRRRLILAFLPALGRGGGGGLLLQESSSSSSILSPVGRWLVAALSTAGRSVRGRRAPRRAALGPPELHPEPSLSMAISRRILHGRSRVHPHRAPRRPSDIHTYSKPGELSSEGGKTRHKERRSCAGGLLSIVQMAENTIWPLHSVAVFACSSAETLTQSSSRDWRAFQQHVNIHQNEL